MTKNELAKQGGKKKLPDLLDRNEAKRQKERGNKRAAKSSNSITCFGFHNQLMLMAHMVAKIFEEITKYLHFFAGLIY